MRTLVTGISTLVRNADTGGRLGGTGGVALPDEAILDQVTDAALLIEDGIVTWSGPAADVPAEPANSGAATHVVDLGGRPVIPGFVDSHNHLVFAGDRTAEFNARMSGQTYSAGGIRTTVAATRAATDEELEANLVALADQALASGSTTIEIKSGYGLSTADEVRALTIAGRHTEETTCLAAHIVPPEYAENSGAYVDLVVNEIIPACAGLARWIDVFCEDGAFDAEASRRIIEAGVRHGMRPRLHANQLGFGPGLALAAELGAYSADHATHATDADLAALADSGTVATLLPGAEFSTRAHYPDARRFVAAGVRLALATDCNPGSSFTNNMPFCLAVAVRDMHFTPAQALHAATTGGAAALGREDVGHLRPGARADFIVLDPPSWVHLAYRPGVPAVGEVWKNGRLAARNVSETL